MNKAGLLGFSLFVAALSMSAPSRLGAQQVNLPDDYRVGTGDVIYILVPQRPDLSREAKIDKNGDITLPLVGNVRVSGLTAREMEARLLQAMREYYPSLSGLSVRIQEAVSQIIYVLGQVGKPGKYAFPASPNLWEAIREAGGPTANASLDNVRIVKDKSKGGTSEVVNVMEALEMASIDDLPELEGGDTVVIPERETTYAGSFGVNVFGSVQHPGIYRLQGRHDLLSAVLLAGGPAGGAALNHIKIIRPGSDGNVETIEVDLEKYLKEGDPLSNPKLQPGDTVHIPAQNRIAFLFKNDLGFIMNIVTTGVTVAALIVSVKYYQR
jgi:polysaccharide export outer membrane protein